MNLQGYEIKNISLYIVSLMHFWSSLISAILIIIVKALNHLFPDPSLFYDMYN